MADERVRIIIDAVDNASQVVRGLGQTVVDHSRQIGLAMTAAGGAIVAGAGLSVKAASDLQESMNAVRVVFGETSDQIFQFSEIAAESAGLSRREFNQLATQTGAMLANVGFGMEEVADTTIALTQRAADMASVFNTDVNQALGAINAALRGEIDPIERFGVSMRASLVDARALELGLADSTKEITDQARQVARLSLIFEQTQKVEGDFVRTSDELANSIRVTTAQMGNFREDVGQALIPLLQELLTAVRPILQNITAWVKQNPELTATIVKVVASVGGLMLVLGPLLVALPGIIVAVKLLAAGFLLLLSPVGLVILAIGGIVAAMFIWRDKLPGIFKAVGDALEKFVNFWINGINLVIEALNKLPKVNIDTFEQVNFEWEHAGEVVRDAADAIIEKIQSLVPEIQDVGQEAVDTSFDLQDMGRELRNLEDPFGMAFFWAKQQAEILESTRRGEIQAYIGSLRDLGGAIMELEDPFGMSFFWAKQQAEIMIATKDEAIAEYRKELEAMNEALDTSNEALSEQVRLFKAIQDTERRRRQLGVSGGPFIVPIGGLPPAPPPLPGVPTPPGQQGGAGAIATNGVLNVNVVNTVEVANADDVVASSGSTNDLRGRDVGVNAEQPVT